MASTRGERLGQVAIPGFGEGGRVEEPAYDEFRRVARLTNSVSPAASTTQLLSEYDHTRSKVAAPAHILANDASNYSGLGMQKDLTPIGYDALHRLTSASYATDAQSEAFAYDDLGNRVTFTQRDTTVVQYAHNKVNEYEKIGTPLPPQPNVRHDDAGNLIGDEDGYGYVYDYDNKLVLIFQDDNADGDQDPGEATLATYVRDALGRRIEYQDHGSAGPVVTTRYYHDGDNAVVEYNDKITPGIALRRYFVHGMQYVDERAVVHDFGFNQDFYYYLADLYTVDGLVNNLGHEVERYTYDVYGKPEITVVKIYDVNYDGTVDSTDWDLVDQNEGQDPCMVGPIFDVNRDGTIDPSDFNAVMLNAGPALATSPQSSIGNPYLFTGRTLDTIYDGTTMTPIHVTLQDNRNWSYDSEHGRWLQRDPLEYIDGMNMYEYVKTRPTVLYDATGTWSAGVHNRLTFNWSLNARMQWDAAKAVGEADIGTDDFWTGLLPWVGDQSRHFNRNSSGGDTRMFHKLHERRLAEIECNAVWGPASPTKAALHLGRGLHSIQDWWAHGDYSKGPHDTTDAHGASYDTWGLDAVDENDLPVNGGRASQYFTTYYNERSGMHLRSEEDWPHWASGPLRQAGTEKDSTEYIESFLSWVKASGDCKCKEYFINDTVVSRRP